VLSSSNKELVFIVFGLSPILTCAFKERLTSIRMQANRKIGFFMDMIGFADKIFYRFN
jgi:hypothetical protein